jgi:DNA-binding NarL/FixJ family response regulator
MNDPIKVIIVDDHDVIHFGIKTILQNEPDIAVVDSVIKATTLEALWWEIVRLCRAHDLSERDVILLDLMMEMSDGEIELTLSLLERLSTLPPRVFVITGYRKPHAHLHMAVHDQFIDGLILKDEAFSDALGECIRQVSEGTPFYSERARELLALDNPPDAIYVTRQQMELLNLRASMTAQRIALRLGKTENSIYTALHRLRKKFDAEDDVALVTKAQEAQQLGQIIIVDSTEDYP